MNLVLKTSRVMKGLRSTEVAQRAGISLTYYSLIENGWAIPSKKTQIEIAKALGATRKVFWNGGK